MQGFIDLLVKSGKTGIELALHILLPIMVLMMSFMRVFQEKGILKKVALFLSPIFAIFGLPGLGVFAIIQIYFVSFAAPISTLKLMENDPDVTNRKISATLAAVFTISQANAVFPLATIGLNIPITMVTSLIGALLASFLTYKIFSRKKDVQTELNPEINIETKDKEKKTIMQTLTAGAEEGFQLVLKSVPLLILAIIFVNILKSTGVINFLSKTLSPAFTKVGLPGVAILPIITKYIAGGTAMMGVSMKLVSEGSLTALQLNKIAGFIINPLDPVGVAFYCTAGARVSYVVVPAIKGALIGILFRGILHLVIF